MNDKIKELEKENELLHKIIDHHIRCKSANNCKYDKINKKTQIIEKQNKNIIYEILYNLSCTRKEYLETAEQIGFMIPSRSKELKYKAEACADMIHEILKYYHGY